MRYIGFKKDENIWIFSLIERLLIVKLLIYIDLIFK